MVPAEATGPLPLPSLLRAWGVHASPLFRAACDTTFPLSSGQPEGACAVAGVRSSLLRHGPQLHEPGGGQQGGHAPGANPHRHGLLLCGRRPEEEAGSRAAARVGGRGGCRGGAGRLWASRPLGPSQRPPRVRRAFLLSGPPHSLSEGSTGPFSLMRLEGLQELAPGLGPGRAGDSLSGPVRGSPASVVTSGRPGFKSCS